MIIAIIIAHYIEFFIDSSGEENSIFKMVLEIILLKEIEEKSDEELKEMGWYKKLKHNASIFVKNYVVKHLHQEKKMKPTFDVEHLKNIALGSDNVELIDSRIHDLITKPKNLIRKIDYKHKEAIEKMKEMYFWAEQIDNHLIRNH
jgi:hypothetical protein